MLYARPDGAGLWYEETGSGYPNVFVHEFGGDLRSWEQQVRRFWRDYRCIRFNARGYPPSDVPEQGSADGQAQAPDDIAAVMKALPLDKAHVVGLSMGAFATLYFGLRYPDRASVLVVAGIGSGARREQREALAEQCDQAAQRFLDERSTAVAREMGMSATRIQLLNKDPLGWQEFVDHLGEHSRSTPAASPWFLLPPDRGTYAYPGTSNDPRQPARIRAGATGALRRPMGP